MIVNGDIPISDDIEVLRPREWVEQHRAEAGSSIPLSFPECGIDHIGLVASLNNCPEVQIPGDSYRTVTGTSLDRDEFVPAGDLFIGEELWANEDVVSVLRREVRSHTRVRIAMDDNAIFNELHPLMCSHAFEFVFYWKQQRGFMWGRPSQVVGCFEQLHLIRDGQGLDVYAQVSVTTGEALYMQMTEDAFLTTCVSVRRMNKIIAVLESEAIPKCVELAGQYGQHLILQTSRSREAAEFYLSLLPEKISNLEHYWMSLKEAASEQQREQARFSLRTGVLAYVHNTSEEQDLVFWAYQIASFTITLHATAGVQHGFFSAGADPYEEIDLAWCFQFLTIEIIRRFVPPDKRPGMLREC